MKRFRKILPLLLVVMLLVSLGTGCGKNDGDTNVKGRYVETDITPTGIDGNLYSFVLDNGTLVCYDEALEVRYESVDGGANWQQTQGPGANSDRYQNVSNVVLLENGNLLVYINAEGLFTIAPDGTETAFSVAEIDALGDDTTPMFTIFKALPGNRLLLSYMPVAFGFDDAQNGGGAPMISSEDENTPQDSPTADGEETTRGRQGTGFSFGGMEATTALYDAETGEKIIDLAGYNGSYTAANGDVLYLADETNRITAYNLSDGSAKSDESRTLPSASSDQRGGERIMFAMGGQGAPLNVDAEGTLYYINESGLQQITTSGEVAQLLDSSAYALGSPNANAQSVSKLPDGSFVVHMNEGMTTGRLYKYTWDDNATLDPNKTILIWSLEDSDIVRAAINAMRAKYPDAIIQYEIALGDGAVSAEDAIKNLNTQLLNGDGPDVIILDGCPIESYKNEGLLLDLQSYLNTSDIFTEVLEPFSEGGLYYLPTQFSVPVLLGNAEDISNVNTLDQLVQAAVDGKDITPMTQQGAGSDPFASVKKEDRAALDFGSFDEAFDMLWSTSAPSIVTKDGLNSEELNAFVEAVKALSDKYDLTTESEEAQGGVAAFSAGGGRVNRISNGIMTYMMQRTLYGADTLNNITFLQIATDRGGVEDAEITSFPGLTEGTWIPSSIAGVNADSQVKELAAEFVTAMLSETVQSASYGSGFPVTNKGVENQIAALNAQREENGEDPFEFDFDALTSLMKIPSIEEQVITDAVKQTTLAYCKGELGAKEAMEKIEQNLKNYLAERS